MSALRTASSRAVALGDNIETRPKRSAAEASSTQNRARRLRLRPASPQLFCPIDLSEPTERGFQEFELLGRRAFLRSEDTRRPALAEQRIPHIDGRDDFRQAQVPRSFNLR